MGSSVLEQRLAIANEALRQALAGLDPDATSRGMHPWRTRVFVLRPR